MAKTTSNFWRENFRTSFAAWNGLQGVVALVVWVIGIGVYLGWIKDNADRWVDVFLGISLLLWFPFVMLVITPRKMWIKAQDTIAEFEDRFTPRLAIKIDSRSTQNKLHADGKYESWIRLQIVNLSDQSMDYCVTIRDCQPLVEMPIPFELSDAFCDQPPSPVPAMDCGYVELARAAGAAIHLRMYASDRVRLPLGEYRFTVRASGYSYPCFDEKIVKICSDEVGRLTASFVEP